MKVGDLVISIWLNPSPIGIVIGVCESGALPWSSNEVLIHVGWVSGASHWLEPEDLEIISESR